VTNRVLLLDFGSQTTPLIARRRREALSHGADGLCFAVMERGITIQSAAEE
jgi:GMP synthase-like glutamine amidotransferase